MIFCFTLLTSTSIFACGCIDAFASSSGVTKINFNYNSLDSELATKVKEVTKNIDSLIENEHIIKDNLSKGVILDSYKILKIENAIFSLEIFTKNKSNDK